MAGTNLEVQGLYIPQPLTPGRSPLIHPRCFLSLQCHHESYTISDEPPRKILTAGDVFHHKLASSSSSSLEILEVITATPLAAMEPESPRQASKSEAAEVSERSSDTESAMPETSGGDWDSCNINEEILSSLEQEGRIAIKEISRWRVEPSAAMPAPLDEEVVILKSHIDRGLSLLPSYFLKGVLRHYRL
jgi:hypothetical protein